jgi:DUF1009 family protein
MRKLGLIAGRGPLPVALANHCQSAGRGVFVARLKGMSDPVLAEFPGIDVGMNELGKLLKALKGADCEAICMVGAVDRPDLTAMVPDFRGLRFLPTVLMASRKGDDALLRALVKEFESEGFVVEGAHEVMGDLTLPAGPLGRHRPDASHQIDIERAMEVARAVGALDVGQGAVACDGLVLAVEAQEGTDAMLRRVAELPEAIRGAPGKARGVLAKAPKPIQDTRVDLPTIGPHTLQRAARAGLAGIAGEAGKVLVLDREDLIRTADELGLFVVGIPAEPA